MERNGKEYLEVTNQPKLERPSMRRAVLAFLTLLAISLSIQPATAAGIVRVGNNVSLVPNADRQLAETTVAIDPRNPNIIVAGAQDYNLQACCPITGHRWHGYYRSADDGQTWTRSFLPGFPGDTSPQGLASPLHGFNLTTDPVLAFDNNGNVYYTGVAIQFHAPDLKGFTVFVAKYTNDGSNYFGTTLIQSGTDKPWIAVDTSGGPNNGNVYVAYQGISTGKIAGSIFVRSADGGATFSRPILVPGGEFVTSVVVATTGIVYVASVGADNILVSKSTDGGATLSAPITAAAGLSPLPQTDLIGNRFRVLTLPQMAVDSAGVYIVMDDNRTGTSQILFIRSTNGGATWTTPVTVNDVSLGEHFFPTVAVSGGKINIAWYDSRAQVNANGTITALDVFYAKSIDAGATFSENVRITGSSFNPNIVTFRDFARGGAFIGDYNQIASTPTEAHPVWADTINACNTVDPLLGCIDQDVFTAAISI